MRLSIPPRCEWFAVQLTGPADPEENAERLRAALHINGHHVDAKESSDEDEGMVVRICGEHPAQELREVMQAAGLQGYFDPCGLLF